jgi:hypothetical protein
VPSVSEMFFSLFGREAISLDLARTRSIRSRRCGRVANIRALTSVVGIFRLLIAISPKWRSGPSARRPWISERVLRCSRRNPVGRRRVGKVAKRALARCRAQRRAG